MCKDSRHTARMSETDQTCVLQEMVGVQAHWRAHALFNMYGLPYTGPALSEAGFAKYSDVLKIRDIREFYYKK